MDSDEGKKTGFDIQADYEATVLEFLDKEIAASNSAVEQKKKEESEELEALVSDLLKQAISESDQPQNNSVDTSAGTDMLFSDLHAESESDLISSEFQDESNKSSCSPSPTESEETSFEPPVIEWDTPMETWIDMPPETPVSPANPPIEQEMNESVSEPPDEKHSGLSLPKSEDFVPERVVAESDPTQEGRKDISADNDATGSHTLRRQQIHASDSRSLAKRDLPESPTESEKRHRHSATIVPEASFIVPRSPASNRMPLFAAGFLFLLVVVGASIYFFSGSSVSATDQVIAPAQAETSEAALGGKANAQLSSRENVKTPAQRGISSDPKQVSSKVEPAGPIASTPQDSQTIASKPEAIVGGAVENDYGLEGKPEESQSNEGKENLREANEALRAPGDVTSKQTPLLISKVLSDSASEEDQSLRAPGASAVGEIPIKNTLSHLMPNISLAADSGVNKDATKIAESSPPRLKSSRGVSATPASGAAAPRKVTPAVLVSKVNPIYPELAKRTRTSASIILDLEINEQGKVVSAVPVSGPELFREAAVKAVLQWRYKPASVGGVNVPSQSRVTIAFNLN
jgi:TonB family protein